MSETGSAEPGTGPRVVFARSGREAVWTDRVDSILELAEDAGLSPDFSCRSGVCMTCVTALTAGEIEYVEEPLYEPEPGKVLICCSRPRGDVVLDL